MIKLFAMLLSAGLMFSGCAKSEELSSKEILQLFGCDRAEVLESLSLSDDLLTEEEHDELRVILPDDDESRETSLIFYNDVLMGVRYFYEEAENAYTFAKELRPQIDEVFGQKTTYPGVVSSSSDYFDNVSDVAQLEPIITYYEDWTPEVDEEQIRKMLDGRETERVDARLSFTVIPELGTEIKIRYVALIKRG